MTDRIIEAKISLKTIVSILSCFGFHIKETTQGEKRSCMLLVKDEFSVFVEKGKIFKG